jgi:hypothetical protein
LVPPTAVGGALIAIVIHPAVEFVRTPSLDVTTIDTLADFPAMSAGRSAVVVMTPLLSPSVK